MSRRNRRQTFDALAGAVDAKRRELEALTGEVERAKAELEAVRKANPIDEQDAMDFVVIGVVDGSYVVHLGRGIPPSVGSELRLPDSPNLTFVVARASRRDCLYLEPTRPGGS